MKIISADERLAETHYPKILIAGPAGIGKTSLLRTLSPVEQKRTLFIDVEAGDLAVQDVPVSAIRPEDGESWKWLDLRNLACLVSGPDASVPEGLPYSQQHYDKMVETYGQSIDLKKFDILFIDSITVAARLCLRWAMQQPEAFTDKGKVDTRGGYGLLGREMIMWLSRLQQTRGKAVVFVAILENAKDANGWPAWEIQMDGSKAGRELPGIVDQVIAMGMVPHPLGEKKPEDAPDTVRAFLCTLEADNFVGFIPKDRSGLLSAYERPDLSALFAKLTAKTSEQEPETTSKKRRERVAAE
jgi:hypothetical protein